MTVKIKLKYILVISFCFVLMWSLWIAHDVPTAINNLASSEDMVNRDNQADALLQGFNNFHPPMPSVLHWKESEVTSRPDALITADPGNITKVILYAYMRSGSTWTGELFNQNDDSFYLFEPLDGIYSALYGTQYGWYPLDILYHHSGTKRQIPTSEREYLTSATLQLLNCNFSLPVDIMFHNFVIMKKLQKTSAYINCLQTGPIIREPSACKAMIKDYCPQHSWDKLQDCYNNFHVLSMPEVRFNVYLHCMKVAEERARSCTKLLEDSCMKSAIRSFKTIRLSMELVEDIIKEDNSAKMIYLVRDPRGIIHSRRHTSEIALLAEGDWSISAKLLCQRMQDDLAIFEDLKNEYSDKIMFVRYEDIVQRPFEMAANMMRFLGSRTLPESVKNFLNESMYGNADDGPFDTTRRNATEAAHKWKKEMSTDVKKKVNILCADAIKQLGYDL